MYTEPSQEKWCGECAHKEYDSFHSEVWCGRNPAAEGIGDRLLIDNYGTCEHWESWND